jgi:hypothetical protein
MSAFMVSKHHIDLIVTAALHYGSRYDSSAGVSWWRTDEEGNFQGWNEVRRYERTGDDYKQYVTPDQLGQMLVSENVASVSSRYPNDGPGELPGPTDCYYLKPYTYEPTGRIPTPGEVFKAIDCLSYQSCEHPGWYSSEACRMLEALRLGACTRVEGYEEAPWEFTKTEKAHV